MHINYRIYVHLRQEEPSSSCLLDVDDDEEREEDEDERVFSVFLRLRLIHACMHEARE